jgi:hypothetical protein
MSRKALGYKFAAMAVAAICIVFLVRRHEEQSRFDHLPEIFGPASITYFKEETWGIGMPGDNETGVIMYEISMGTTREIQASRLAFFGKPGDLLFSRDKQNHYFDWQPTPVTELFATKELCGPSRTDMATDCAQVMQRYLGRYGFGIEVEPAFLKSINAALSQPGSFVGQGRHGLLIVVPSARKVVYAYAG